MKVLRVGGDILREGKEWAQWPNKVLIDGDITQLLEHELCLIELLDRPLRPMHYPQWRGCHYLPLVDDDGSYAAGITVNTVRGIAGITVHSRRGGSTTVGYRGPESIFFALAPVERIVSVSMVEMMRGTLDKASVMQPCMIVRSPLYRYRRVN